jgi:hypothetical protein
MSDSDEVKRLRKQLADARLDLEEAKRDHERKAAELREERDRQADLITRMRDQLEECGAQIDRWKEAFNMVPNDAGVWEWSGDLVDDLKYFEMYVELRSKWNRYVGLFNAKVAPKNTGRPLACSEAQRDRVLAHRKAGKSLRWISEQMNLGLQTVRTVIDRKDGTDRATLMRLERIAPNKAAEARARRSRRDIASLPKRINRNVEAIAGLIKEAKGVK